MKIILLARQAEAPSDVTPFVFEKRVMARIAALPKPDKLSLWALGLWRAAASSVLVMLLISLLILTLGDNRLSPSTNLASDLENVVLAPPETLGDFW